MKGLILSGGKGTRLRPLTHTRAKQLIPIGNKANIDYVIEDLVGSGITDIGIIVGETAEEVKAALGDGSAWGATFTYIAQASPLGLAHAVATARDYLADEPFVMYLGDNLLAGGIGHLVDDYSNGARHSHILLAPVPNPSAFGVAVLGERDEIVRLVEKPKEPPSNLALVGVYLFEPVVHDIIEKLEPSSRGEYEITDAIQGLLDAGYAVKAHRTRGFWKDTGRPDDLLDANRLVLSDILYKVEGNVENSQLSGNVVVEKGAVVRNSELRGPIAIAAGALVENSYVGPYTSIGKNVKVIDSEVEYSVLFDDSEVSNLPYRLDASVLGQGVKVHSDGSSKRKNTLKMLLGDRSEVEL